MKNQKQIDRKIDTQKVQKSLPIKQETTLGCKSVFTFTNS